MSGTCFYPDGTLSGGGYPCWNPTDGGSAPCCGLGHYCFSTGVCLDPDGMTYYRGSCTDKNWRSPQCAQVCITGAQSTLSSLWPCGGGNFTCVRGQCGTSNVFHMASASIIVNAAVTATQSSSSGSSILTTSSSVSGSTQVQTITSTPSCTDTSTQPDVCPAHTGELAAVGAGVGVPLLLALLGAIFLLFRERKKSRSARPQTQQSVDSLVPLDRLDTRQAYPYSPPYVAKARFASADRQELPNDHPIRELEGSTIDNNLSPVPPRYQS